MHDSLSLFCNVCPFYAAVFVTFNLYLFISSKILRFLREDAKKVLFSQLPGPYPSPPPLLVAGPIKKYFFAASYIFYHHSTISTYTRTRVTDPYQNSNSTFEEKTRIRIRSEHQNLKFQKNSTFLVAFIDQM